MLAAVALGITFSHSNLQKRERREGSLALFSFGEECFPEDFSKLESTCPGLAISPVVITGGLGIPVCDLFGLHGGQAVPSKKKGVGMADGWAAEIA